LRAGAGASASSTTDLDPSAICAISHALDWTSADSEPMARIMSLDCSTAPPAKGARRRQIVLAITVGWHKKPRIGF